jgi:hypothetical protein
MLDVLRAAAARIEDYARVRIFPVEEDLCVSGHAADELILLVAELMDNAVMLSREPVAVHVRRLADRTVVQVIDLGIGIDERRRHVLNDRLAAPVVDVDSVSRMGLTVVGLLAAHHGLRVELRSNLPCGTIAEIAVPGALLRLPASQSTTDDARAKHRARPAALAAPPVPRPRTVADRPVAAAGESTAELPVFASPPGPMGMGRLEVEWTPNGLPVRSPQAHEFPDRPTDRGFSRRRDPRHVAAALSAYARGISQGRAQQRPLRPH